MLSFNFVVSNCPTIRPNQNIIHCRVADWILRGLSFAGRMCVASGLSAAYVWSPELFPTVLRSFGLGACSMVSRIGGLASPYVADLVSGTADSWLIDTVLLVITYCGDFSLLIIS